MAKGRIRRLVRDRGFGFIAAEDGRELFFHRSSLLGLDFTALKEGDPVEFEVEKSERGPKAVRLHKGE